MTKRLDDYKDWTGGIEDLVAAASAALPAMARSGSEPLNVRLIRDYINRGLLGETGKSGRELVFGYANLLRLVVARLLLADGWSLGKIKEFLELSSLADIEAVLPGARNPALEALEMMRSEMPVMAKMARRQMAPLARAAQTSTTQLDLHDVMRRLGSSADAPTTEETTLIEITPWFRVLVATGRLPRLTIYEAEDLGRAVAASLVQIISKRGKTR